jgi:hypothetical protein
MKFHTESLKAKQLKVLRQMSSLAQDSGFYLAGGTALAIYFGHRISVDLDWFIPKSMGDALVLAERLRSHGLKFVTQQTAPGTLHGTIAGVRVTFLEFRYPLLRPLTTWRAMGCSLASLASLDDLACMKLSAIAQRGARKDFCDIYALGIKYRPLREILGLYKRKFRVKDIGPVLYGLSYFDDAESEPMPRMLWDVNWRTIKSVIQDWVKEIGRM